MQEEDFINPVWCRIANPKGIRSSSAVSVLFLPLPAMESTRQQRIARLIQKEIADIFLRESRQLFGHSMITVTKTYVTRDLAIARVYLSIYGNQDPSAIIAMVRNHTREIRTLLANRVRLQIRVIPALEFYQDDSLDYIENIERLLKE